MRLSSATYPKSISGLDHDLDFAIEIYSKTFSFRNRPEIFFPNQRWRRRILEKLVLSSEHIFDMKCDSRDGRF